MNIFTKLQHGINHCWIVFVCVLIVTITRSGFYYSFGIIVSKLNEDYQRSMSELIWIGTGAIALSNIMSFLPTFCIKRLGRNGHRICGIFGTLLEGLSLLCTSFVEHVPLMFFTYTFLFGIGSSFVNMASSLILTELFPKGHKRHVLATTCVNSGFAVASLIYNPLVNCLVENLSWKSTFRIQSIILVVVGLPCSFIFVPKVITSNLQEFQVGIETEQKLKVIEPENGNKQITKQMQPKDKQHLSCKTKFKSFFQCSGLGPITSKPEIVCWCLATLLNPIGYFMPFYILPHYMKTNNLSNSEVSLAMTLLSLSECVLYILAALPGDYLVGKLIYVNMFACLGMSILTFVWSFWDSNFGAILSFTIIDGALIGLNYVYIYAGSAESTDLRIDIVWSITNAFSGMGIIIVPLFTGTVFDFSGSYKMMFIVLACSSLLNCIFYSIIPFIKYKRSRKLSNHPLAAIEIISLQTDVDKEKK